MFLSRRAEKFLGQLTDAVLYRRLRGAIDALANDARPERPTRCFFTDNDGAQVLEVALITAVDYPKAPENLA